MRILDELRELEDYFMSMLKNGSHIVEIYEQVTLVVVKFTFNSCFKSNNIEFT